MRCDNQKRGRRTSERQILRGILVGLTGAVTLLAILIAIMLSSMPRVASATSQTASETFSVTTDGTASRSEGQEAEAKGDGEKASGKRATAVTNNTAVTNDTDVTADTEGLNMVDAVVLTIVLGIVTLAIRSLAKEGARRCSGNCACCGMTCDERGTKRVTRDLSKDPVLLAKLEEVKQSVGTE